VSTDPNRIKHLFLAALDRPTAERPAFLSGACEGDPGLRAAVERLLAAHDTPDGRIETPAAEPDFTATGASPSATLTAAGGDAASNDTADHAPWQDAGIVIAGKYKLIEEIGEGGMGTVWMAQQTEPVKRNVAVKLIKAGMDSKAVLARFEAERQALALMNHPNIAGVLDAGAAPDGRPFFVMELVKGVPITQFCDGRRLDPRQRLELFVPVCQAIQHAHQKGIIHRDVKPSNVLIALYDDRPVPKVIDFGVAKATGRPLTDKTLATGFGAVVGTPEYMSPEQANFNNLDVDTRSDVYALGVLLYELLAGSPPFSRKDLARAGLIEILRVVREVEPQRPSTKLSTADALPSLSANRGTEPKKLTRLLRGELDWIVMKALEKDRNRRYESANGFAADVQRYLAGEPVQAVPPSVGYRLKKFYRRNRGPVLAAGLLFAVLLIGVVGTSYGLVRANRSARREANRSAQLERSNVVLGSILKTLDPHDENQTAGPLRVQLGHSLRKAVADLEGDSVGEPLAVARLQYTLGVSLLGLGYAEDALRVLAKARETFDRELGPDSEESMNAVAYLGDAYDALDDTDESYRLHKEVLDRRTCVLGPDNPDTLVSMNDYAASLVRAHRVREAVPLLEAALAKLVIARGADHPFTLLLTTDLAAVLSLVGRGDEALVLAEQAYERTKTTRTPSHPRAIHAATTLGAILSGTGKKERAVSLLEENLARARSELGPDHPFTIQCAEILANVLVFRQNERSNALLEEVVALLTTRYGPRHPKTLAATCTLAVQYRLGRRFDKSEAITEEALTSAENRLGPDHDTTLELVNNLSQLLLETKRTERGVTLAERYLAGIRRHHPEPDDDTTLTALNNLGEAYRKAGKPDRALPLLEEAVAGSTRRRGPNHNETLNTVSNLAFVLAALHRTAEAVPLLERATRGTAPAAGQKPSANYSGGVLKLARVYRELGQFEKAAATYEQAIAALTSLVGEKAPVTLSAIIELADTRMTLGQSAAAVKLLERSIPIQEKVSGPTKPNTLLALELLTTAYSTSNNPDVFVATALKLYERRMTANGPDDENTLYSENLLGRAYQQSGKFDRAERVYRELVAKRERINGRDNAETFPAVFNLALALTSQKKMDEGLPLMERAVAGTVKHRGADSPEARSTTVSLALNYLEANKPDRAVPLLEQVCRAAKDAASLNFARRALADAYAQVGRTDEALALIKEQVTAVRKSNAPVHGDDLVRVGSVLLRLRAWAEAEPVLREGLALHEKAQPGTWRAFSTKSQLGHALLGLKMYDKAEPLLLAGYEGLAKTEATIPPLDRYHLADAADRLIELYTILNRPDELKKWLAERAKYPLELAPLPRRKK
jgi:serine/threonine protein kinase/lipopolysaccharide biosynthesis regulator YciM